MAAGQGFKTFTTGEVLTAGDVNGYLMQGVLVFASAAARDGAITSPQEGQFAYLKDTNVTTYYTGSAWANLDTTGMTNPMTTTGDTIYSSSGSTPARLGIGTTGQVLTVSGGVPTWATSSSGATLLTQSTSANYYKTSLSSVIQNSDPIAFQSTFYFPVYLPTGTADRLVIRTATGWTGTATARLGIYNNTNGLPTTVKVDAGTVSVTSSSTVYSITISTAITAGWYWLACNVTDGGGTNSYTSFDTSTGSTIVNGFVSSITSSSPNSKLPVLYYQTGVTGAFATAGTLLSLDGFSPVTMVRVS